MASTIHMRTTESLRRVRTTSMRPSGGVAPSSSVSLAMGEPDFDPPGVAVKALELALREGWTHYGPLNGDPELRALIAEQTSALSVVRVTGDQVCITHGATAALTAAVLATVNPGDRVVIPEPTYSLYSDLVEMVGGVPVPVPLRSDHHLDLDVLMAAAKSAVLVILCNPGNPTGRVLDRAQLEELGARLDRQVLVLVDEAYGGFVYSGSFTSSVAVESLANRLILVNTFSKTYAMTGFRLGYCIAPEQLASDISLAHRTMNGAPNAAVQRAGLAVLRGAEADVEYMCAQYRERKDYVVSRLRSMPGVTFNEPEGAFYVFMRYPGGEPSVDFVDRLKNAGVLVRAGAEYGPSGEGHIRLSFASSMEDLSAGLDRLESVMRRDSHRPTSSETGVTQSVL